MRMIRVLQTRNVGGRRFLHITSRQCFKCLDSALKDTIDKRNIGVIAHIDAGKTTTTEQLLYLTGLIPAVGDVDHGNTITDFMELERERGITIQSAAITCIWRQHRVNIIDTPGHIDFTLEVERALRVMDGTVTVLDGATGVQAQTLTVWRQAQKFKLPTIFFVNKMDKPLANFEMCIASIENRLGQSVLPVVVPIVGADGRFVGLVDVVERTHLDVTAGADAKWSPIVGTSRQEEVHGHYEERLLAGLADADEAFANRLLTSDELIHRDHVREALRRLTLSRAVSPLACGTALRCSTTVRPVLDMIVDYLPGPSRQAAEIPHDNSYALVFKIGHDKRHGRLDYARVFKGSIRSGGRLLNASRGGAAETGVKLFTPYSDLLHPTSQVDEGDVVVMTGLRSTVTGDTLIDGATLKQPIREADLRPYILQGIERPEPVFSCSIEPPSAAAMHKFEKALAELCVEDPSLHFVRDEHTGQNVLQGMGELHIEVVKERLKRDYGLNVFIGKLQVGYREVLIDSITHSTFKEDCFGDKQRAQWCSLQLQLDFDASARKFQKVVIDMQNSDEREVLRDDWLKYINEGCRMALYHGPLLGFPVDNLAITLKSFVTSGNRINSALINAAAGTCVRDALRLAGTQLIEPIMRLEITLFPASVDATPSLAAHIAVLGELAYRRADVVDERSGGKALTIINGHLTFIDATIPLSETTDISTRMRELTSGLCTLHMEMADYQRVLPDVQSTILANYSYSVSV